MGARILSALKLGGDLNEENIAEGARRLRLGELVAFPTETVYGLGANALDEAAVSRIYEAKGRPSNNPLIVHVASLQQARELVREWPQDADILAEAFWPGPLTIVFPRKGVVPDLVTAGGETVAVRVPAHSVALALINECGFPLAAPSANKSNQLSPTTAEHVSKSVGAAVSLILDGGPCKTGIESTVLNLAGGTPTILRPGVLSANFLSGVLGKEVHTLAASAAGLMALLSPGQLPTHYAPQTPLLLASGIEVFRAAEEGLGAGKRIAVMTLGLSTLELPRKEALLISMPDSPADYARDLYAVLHHLDEEHRDLIICEMPPDDLAWTGVRDRLMRAGKLY